MTTRKYPISLALALAAAGSFAGCWNSGPVQMFSCDDPCYGLDAHECDKPCTVCEGACVELPYLGFDDPILLWRGDPADGASAPECPPETPELVFDGYGGFADAHSCPTCRCMQPACELPPALRGRASATCDGTTPMSFDAPDGWNGACATVASGELGSLVIPAPTVSACAPTIDPGGPAPELPAPFSVRARGCSGSADERACADPSKMCVASPAQRPEGFAICIRYLRQGEPKCPEHYPELQALYTGFDDTRSCSPCGCDPPEGSACSAFVSIYGDGSCSRLLGAETVTLTGPKCVAGPDLELGSMTAEWVTNEPGTCAPTGGVAAGEVTPTGATYFCCQSEEVVAIP
ncbi:hypothetical protein [Sorangium sp. So ce341]|uniref:hypothetical protein n=1 Tax=Sorangium sp. So ce341 TaxID=3133302 RepID=UPI003F6140DC